MQLIKTRKKLHFGLALVVALMFDTLIEVFGGFIPVIGDIFDGIAIGILFFIIGPVALLGSFEFVPVIGDIFPTYTAIVIGSYLYTSGKLKLRR